MHEPRFLGSIILSNISIERFLLEEFSIKTFRSLKLLISLVATIASGSFFSLFDISYLISNFSAKDIS